jgi:hypothetical protein
MCCERVKFGLRKFGEADRRSKGMEMGRSRGGRGVESSTRMQRLRGTMPPALKSGGHALFGGRCHLLEVAQCEHGTAYVRCCQSAGHSVLDRLRGTRVDIMIVTSVTADWAVRVPCHGLK